MKKYTLTEDEARSLAATIANKNSPYPDGTLENWFNKYMEEYNKVMNVIERYNQSAD